MRLQDKVVLITGGASGIGRAIAEGVAAEGAHTIVADLNFEGARIVADSISDAGGAARAIEMDVTRRRSVAAGLDEVWDDIGPVDVYLNNAGINRPMKFLDITEDNFERIISVNALSVLIGTQEFAKRVIRDKRRGKVINTASIAGRSGFPSFAPYSAAKAAVISLTQAGARALAADGITVNAFAPGVVATPLWEQLDKDLAAIGEEDSGFAAMADGILLDRPAQPSDIVPTAVFLASADSDYITGQVVPIEGGMILT
ncbi:SDR family NAD(P)-dependent oxidoreductase [Arthrobacter sp. NPDC089319]|uniref:SDR family NAD(P)-dependent oxidoreductase n=1 Tax=Arthrobacter sp. NPDC089319 TaxID=3155915 RepID=UPI00342D0CC0